MSRERRGGARLLDKADLAHSEASYEFEAHHHDAGVSFIVVDAPPRSGPKLHKHSYEEAAVEALVTILSEEEEE